MLIESRAPVRIDFAGAWTDVKYFADAFGGATCNATINRYVTGKTILGAHGDAPEGIAVTYETDIPAGSGLGTSSALNVVWLSLVAGREIVDRDHRTEIAERAYDVETVLGILGGKQDQYAAAHGGFNLFEFSDGKATVHPINLTPSRIAELESVTTLCYTGQARLSSNLHESVWGGFRQGKRQVIDSLFGLRDSAYAARRHLENGNWAELGHLLSQQHDYAKQLDNSLSNHRVETVFELVKSSVIGGKCCGAGGGGCMMFISDTPEQKAATIATLGSAQNEGVQVINFNFELQGLDVTLSS